MTDVRLVITDHKGVDDVYELSWFEADRMTATVSFDVDAEDGLKIFIRDFTKKGVAIDTSWPPIAKPKIP